MAVKWDAFCIISPKFPPSSSLSSRFLSKSAKLFAQSFSRSNDQLELGAQKIDEFLGAFNGFVVHKKAPSNSVRKDLFFQVPCSGFMMSNESCRVYSKDFESGFELLLFHIGKFAITYRFGADAHYHSEFEVSCQCLSSRTTWSHTLHGSLAS